MSELLRIEDHTVSVDTHTLRVSANNNGSKVMIETLVNGQNSDSFDFVVLNKSQARELVNSLIDFLSA